jgi:predicted outer membrane repeat protein
MSRMRIATGAGLSLGAAFALSAPAHAAADIVVDTTTDPAPDSLPNNGCEATGGDECTLREAIAKANADAGQDTIVFASSVSGTIDISGIGGIAITEGVNIQGPTDRTVTVDGATTSSILAVNSMPAPGQTVAISNLTLTRGASTYGAAVYVHQPNPATLNLTNDALTENQTIGGGGAVYSYGQVNVQSSTVSDNENHSGGFVAGAISAKFGISIHDSTFSGNYSNTLGGAIVASGNVDIARSTFDQNSSDSNGGAIELASDTAGTAEITDSTFTGNFGNAGGAIHAISGSPPLTISRSTLSGNKSAEGGGAIADYGNPLTVQNTTISGNTASYNGFNSGGALYLSIGAGDPVSVTGSTVANNDGYLTGGILRVAGGGAPDTEIDNTIVAGNTKRTPNTAANADLGGLFAGSFDLVQDTTGSIAPGGNIVLGQDPQLGPLQNNGGPTMTRKPATGSPAIDQGNAFGLTTDQRGAGFARTFDVPSIANPGDGTDIGAIELQASDFPSSTPPATTPPVQRQKKRCKKKRAKKHSASAAKKKCKKKKKR